MNRRACAVLAAVLLSSSAVMALSSPAGAAPDTYPVQEGFVDANGLFLYYMALGRGTPLVVLHGGPGDSHEYLLPYLLPLARHHRVVFIDERGSGKSGRLEDPRGYTVEAMVEDVEAVRSALGLGRIDLLGHSYGGVLAQAYALAHQDHLAHLVLCSTFHSTRELNRAFARMKRRMPADLRRRIDQMEAKGLFGHGKEFERRRYAQA
jgi:proline iminopeptidase